MVKQLLYSCQGPTCKVIDEEWLVNKWLSVAFNKAGFTMKQQAIGDIRPISSVQSHQSYKIASMYKCR
jgi:hypothetical protein